MEDYKVLLDKLLQEESDLQFSEFTNNTAFRIGSRIIEKAIQENKAIVVTILRNGETLFHTKMNDKNTNNDLWVKRKNNVVHHFNHSSYYMHVLLKSREQTIESNFLDPKDFAAEGGAFPIIIKNVGVVGTITVSGLPGDEDHGMVTSVLKEFLLG